MKEPGTTEPDHTVASGDPSVPGVSGGPRSSGLSPAAGSRSEEAGGQRRRPEPQTLSEIADLARFPSENPNPVLRISAEGAILYSNPAAPPLLDAWQCRDSLVLPPPWRQHVSDTLASGESLQADIESAGRSYSLTFAPIPESGYVNVYALDISERRKSQDELTANLSLLNSLLAAFPGPVVAVGRDHRILLASEAAGGDAVVGRLCYEVFHRRDTDSPPDGEKCSLRGVLSTGRPHRAIHRHDTEKGDRYFEVSAHPFDDGKSGVGGIVEYWHDVTDRERSRETLESSRDLLAERVNERTAQLSAANAQLRESQELFRQLAEHIEDIVWLLDVDAQKMRYLSPAYKRITGWDREAVMADVSAWKQVVHPDDRAEFDSGFVDPVDDSTRECEFRVVRPDGEIRWLRRRISPIRDPETGHVARFAGVTSDITESKEAQKKELLHWEQLMQADKMASLGLMVSGVAHEINNPNNLIMLNAGVIQTFFEAVERALGLQGVDTVQIEKASMSRQRALAHVRELASGIMEGARRISRIVQGLRDFSRADIGDVSRIVEARPLVDAALMIAGNMLGKATSRLTVDHAETLPPLRGNAQALEQVIINLLTNACQALEDKDQAITVRTRLTDAGNAVVIEVIDTGCGIRSRDLGRIMDPFFTTRRDYGGTGLGLSVSYGIVKDHGGTLEFESEIGQGTTARIALPVVTDD